MSHSLKPFDTILQDDKLKCVDIGARGGLQNSWNKFKHLIETDALEPDSVACAREQAAKRPGESWFPIGLAAKTGQHPLYVLGRPSGSSLYPPNGPVISQFTAVSYHRLDKTPMIEAMGFSDFIETYKRPLPNLIKLDTQGSELDILGSLSPAHWRDVLVVQSEVEFVELYKGQPLFGDLDGFMRNQGFELYDILPVRGYRTAGEDRFHYLSKYLGIGRARRDLSCRLFAGDALYMRPMSRVIAHGDRVQLIKMLLILLIYRFLDEGLWLVEQGAAAGILTPNEAAGAIQTIQDIAPKPTLRQRTDKIGKLARKLAKMTGIGQKRVIDYWVDRKWDQ